jgi:hypothetical protein
MNQFSVYSNTRCEDRSLLQLIARFRRSRTRSLVRVLYAQRAHVQNEMRSGER